LQTTGAEDSLINQIIRLEELDGAIGNALLAHNSGMDGLAVTHAYVKLGEALGLDWARAATARLQPSDAWERLLAAGLARDFEQIRLDFLAHLPSGDPVAAIEAWLTQHATETSQFRDLIERARAVGAPSAAMLAQIASQARALLGRQASS
jgi:glutamate dehydrogenase